MKRLSFILAFVLCVVLCVFCFASCEKKSADATTAEQGTTPAADTTAEQGTTPPDTTAPDTTVPPTQPPHVHVPEDHYTIDLYPTCLTAGEQSYYCAECGEKMTETTVAIPADPNAHNVPAWTVTTPADLFHDVGSREGVCLVCEQTVVE